ncbi:VOC family protein [Streptomyces sp. NPDC051907]|uniref:VOC family protein n=1 Tax=Streptomyces sp. NPDC051907 TaxID=3155284 RepID=UPI00344A675A
MASLAVGRWAAGAAATTLLAVGLVAGAPAGAAPAKDPAAVTAKAAVRYGQPGLYAKNIDTLMAFYRDGLGFSVLYRFPETGPGVFGTVVLNDSYYITVSTYDVVKQSTGMKNLGRTALKQSELVILTPNVDAVFLQAKKAGAKVLMAPKDQPWGERSAYVADPEGNLVQISTHNE